MSASRQSDVTRKGVRRVLWITLWLNVAVSAAKILVGKLTLSLSMVADGYHSLVDGSNNVVGLIVTSFAYAPPDEGHPYGHRKFETSAALVIGLLLLALAYRVFEGAVGGFSTGSLPEIRALNFWVMGVTLAVNLFVARYEAREGRRLESGYLLADAAHTRSDVYVTLGVVVSFLGAGMGLRWLDSVVALGIGALITVLAFRILVSSFHVLTDRAAIPKEEVERVVLTVTGVLACGGVRTRGGPEGAYVDLTVHVDGDLSLRAAHEVADRIEEALERAHPGIVDVVVHLEPAERAPGIDEAEAARRRVP
jgi:cation diffusion facilitator family transporter